MLITDFFKYLLYNIISMKFSSSLLIRSYKQLIHSINRLIRYSFTFNFMNRVPVIMVGGFKFITYYAAMLPICLLLSPLCVISSRLFKYFLHLIETDQTYLVLLVLSVELILSLLFMVLLIR
jgi:hypothetical protein